MALIGIVSDIHSNLTALEAVVRDAGQVDEWWCTGDIVGYGPDPNECIRVLQDLGARCIRGNHDDGVLHLDQISWFNSTAGEALSWTEKQLSASSWSFLQELPETLVIDGYRLVHGSPRRALTEYVTSASIAEASLKMTDEPVCLIGHTHIPSSFLKRTNLSTVQVTHREPGDSIAFRDQTKQIVNGGSVGQPRDGDPRAAYGILDTTKQSFTWMRVPYGIGVTQEKMRAARLPSALIERLSQGW